MIFFQKSGTLKIDAGGEPKKALVKGSLTDVELVEVKLHHGMSMPVPNGACLHLASATFDTNQAITGGGGAGGNGYGAPPGWTCDPQAYANGDGCNCDCGVFGPDCAALTPLVFNCGDQNEGVCPMARCLRPRGGWRQLQQRDRDHRLGVVRRHFGRRAKRFRSEQL